MLLGDERDSPRGRIYAIKDMLEKGISSKPEISTHIDRCLSCFSCMTTCPSGVDYAHLVEIARNHIETDGNAQLEEPDRPPDAGGDHAVSGAGFAGQ